MLLVDHVVCVIVPEEPALIGKLVWQSPVIKNIAAPPPVLKCDVTSDYYMPVVLLMTQNASPVGKQGEARSFTAVLNLNQEHLPLGKCLYSV